jgi:signal transduction histidine kinase
MKSELELDRDHSRELDVLRDPERLDRLRATSLLDAPTEEAFDRLTRLATKLLGAPLSTVTLVDDERQFYMSCTGFPEPLATTRQTPLQFSFCRHTVVLGAPLVIPDVRGHPLVGDNPSIEMFGVRAYAGIPLLTAEGLALGTLCVMDFEVRDWTADQISSLTDLAAAVSTEIELRLDIAQRVRTEKALHEAVLLRDEVLGVVSHDLRNPVHTVSMASGLALETLPDAPKWEPMRKNLEIIGRAARQMDVLIRDLLDVASIGSGHLSLHPEPLAAGVLLETACEVLKPLVTGADLHFQCVIIDHEAMVMADSDRITQLLSNLVGNAVKFSLPGGRIELGFEARPDEIRFRVADTGSGIPEDEIPHIFDQFWQSRPTGRQGAGLGLAICMGIAEAHGGRMWATSQQGAGSTFFFSIPRIDDAAGISG